MSLCFVGCTNNIMKDCVDIDALIFISITNGIDTCMVWRYPSSLYYNLNIKCMSEREFYEYIGKVIDQKHVVEMSDNYFQACKTNQVFRNAMVDSIYTKYGLDSIKKYVCSTPVVRSDDVDKGAFMWAVYLLWKKGMYVSIDDETCTWYIKE